ncbi:MAG: Transporter [Hyphomicrobiales bacterium]|nr:Transporter [Hyphomicrobiales bacterium]
MSQIVVPIFLVILVGFVFGWKYKYPAAAEKLINDYILYIALPALLFLAIARANIVELTQWGFLGATLSGILVAYVCGVLWARARGTALPGASLMGMGSRYGTTGYMGIPILIAAFGPHAAVPAAIATILHNIPAIVTVIVTHDLADKSRSNLFASISRALLTTLRNPLVIAVIAGSAFSILHIPLPGIAVAFAQFFGAAAGPTALFALGLGLAGLNVSARSLRANAGFVAPLVLIKIVVQPLVTFGVLNLIFGMQVDIWYATALVMAAQPIGAGAYVFATRYSAFKEEISIAIVISLIVTVVTLSLLLQVLSQRLPS